MFNLKWIFAEQGMNQDDPAQFGYRAQSDNLFTHVIILLICSVLFIPYGFHNSKTEIRILLNLNGQQTCKANATDA
jgi:hypothetical protein